MVPFLVQPQLVVSPPGICSVCAAGSGRCFRVSFRPRRHLITCAVTVALLLRGWGTAPRTEVSAARRTQLVTPALALQRRPETPHQGSKGPRTGEGPRTGHRGIFYIITCVQRKLFSRYYFYMLSIHTSHMFFTQSVTYRSGFIVLTNLLHCSFFPPLLLENSEKEGERERGRE